jgi:hypothetical protein
MKCNAPCFSLNESIFRADSNQFNRLVPPSDSNHQKKCDRRLSAQIETNSVLYSNTLAKKGCEERGLNVVKL